MASLINNLSIRQMRQWALSELTQLEDAEEQIDYLLSGIFHWNYPQLRLNMERQFPNELQTRFVEQVTQLKQHRPVQYVLGKAAFFKSEFNVDERVLIPRPETEELVSWVLADYAEQPLRLLDVGTGSGAIALSLKLERPDWQITASDISVDALQVAQANSRLLKADVQFIQSDVFEQLNPGDYEVIVSNPPYIDEPQRADMASNVLDYEPQQALFASEAGYAIYHRILQGVAESAQQPQALYFEIGYQQGQGIQELIHQYLSQAQVTLRQDASGHDRMVKVVL